MKCRGLELLHTTMAMLALMKVEGDAAILVAVLVQWVATSCTKTIHWEVDTAIFMTMKLLCLTSMKLIEGKAFIGTTFEHSHFFCCESGATWFCLLGAGGESLPHRRQ